MGKKLTTTFFLVSVLVFESVPAWAQTTVDPRIEHDAKQKWFYWPNIAFAAVVVLMGLLLAAIYFVKVIRPRLQRSA